ncbi:hypothetical protein AURDEDRAFT_179818 [Auricularia subglabra TFB-10046 SS5]|nr:hypothetical protein AURDEDRAFT_179818 [Auricularia subglabra TFB-10046 SS5]
MDNLPPELIELIAHFVWDSGRSSPLFKGLFSLASASKTLARHLLPANNALLYARLFRVTFDCGAIERRLPPGALETASLAHELRRRFECMWRFRDNIAGEEETWVVLLMLYEHDARNLPILERHARLRIRARTRLDHLTAGYWMRSLATRSVEQMHYPDAEWPTQTRVVNLLLWILWLTAKEEDADDLARQDQFMLQTVTPFVLGSHRYPLVDTRWTLFEAPRAPASETTLEYLGAPLRLFEPEFMPVVILHYLLRLHTTPRMNPPLPLLSSAHDADWARLAPSDTNPVVRPGIISGIWEGAFIFMDFRDYIRLLHGADPRALLDSHVGEHAQVWKLREHVAPPADAMPHGDALHAHFPRGARVREDRAGVEVASSDEIGGEQQSWTYRLHEPGRQPGEAGQDILLIGEGHSSWGRFNLRGRVRQCDGFITLVKQYVSGGPASRGLWLYRGFVVGGRDGHLVGRWRDVETSVDQVGYEGCFVMSRRRE